MVRECPSCETPLNGDEYRCPECQKDLVGKDGAEDRRRGGEMQ